MENDDPIVFVVDDDEKVREAIEWLLHSVRLAARCFGSARDFLDAYKSGTPGCVILDVRMPGMSGLDVQAHLVAKGDLIPIIFLTGPGDFPMATRAMAAGAFQFIEKPFNNQILIETVQHAVAKSLEDLGDARLHQAVRNRVETLTEREREVLALLIDGASNRSIADKLGISGRTVESHRAHVMEKMQVRSIAELVRRVIEAGIEL